MDDTMNFADLPSRYIDYSSARIVILPVPYDNTSTWHKGADRGPQALLAASAHLELYDIETDSEVYRKGICTLEPVTCPAEPAAMVMNLESSRSPPLPHPSAIFEGTEAAARLNWAVNPKRSSSGN